MGDALDELSMYGRRRRLPKSIDLAVIVHVQLWTSCRHQVTVDSGSVDIALLVSLSSRWALAISSLRVTRKLGVQ